MAQRASVGSKASRSWRTPAVVCALLVGSFMGYGSLAAGPLGMAAVVGVVALLSVSAWRSLAFGPFIIGAGITGAWLLLPALTNTDHALTYPVETGLLPFSIYAGAAVAGVGLAIWTFLHRSA